MPELMAHAIHRVLEFQIEAPYVLRVRFEDETEQVIDFEPILAGEVYRPLRDREIFNQVRVDPDVHTLVWPNGADFDPETLHDWPQYADALRARARQWELATA
jgi:glycine/D-amino acid oxidase-like deaminating enzyme